MEGSDGSAARCVQRARISARKGNARVYADLCDGTVASYWTEGGRDCGIEMGLY